MNIVVSNSPNIPGGAEAGLASTGTYLPNGVNSWYMPTVGGEGGAVYLQHNGTGWELFSSYAVVIVQSDPCAVSVNPWEAVWPSPMVVALESTPYIVKVAPSGKVKVNPNSKVIVGGA